MQCFYGHPELGGTSSVCPCTTAPIGTPAWQCQTMHGF
jgi:hypothetical protein